MTDLELLFLVLVVIYCWECACWLRRGSVAFLTWFGRRWKLAHPGAVLGNQQGGFIFAHPLPPLGTLLAGNQFPLSLSSDAVLAYVAPSVNPGGRPIQTGKCFRFAEIQSVESNGKKVRVNGELLLKAASPAFAAYLAQQLRQLTSLAPAQRANAIEELVRATRPHEANARVVPGRCPRARRRGLATCADIRARVRGSWYRRILRADFRATSGWLGA